MAQQEIELSVHPPTQTECPSFIFNVSSVLENDHRMSYKPQLVSIGPYHHNRGDHLRMMENHKQRYLDNLVRRVGVTEEDLRGQIGQVMEQGIRNCYWSPFNHINHDAFVKMVVVDGCFVIEFFRMHHGVVKHSDGDPLFSIMTINNILLRDLMLAENQLPFKILDILYNITIARDHSEDSKTLSELIVPVLNHRLNGSLNVVRLSNQTVKHLLDLVRQSLIPIEFREPGQGNNDSGVNTILGIEDLRRAGIQICLKDGNETPIAVEFNRKRGMLLMPTLELTDFTFPLFRNFVCLEQCSVGSSKVITTYFFFLSSLIHAEKDMDYLCKKRIIVNTFDTSATVVSLIHQILAGASFDINTCYLSEMFKNVNKYCGRRWRTHFATLNLKYFHTPWSIISVVAAFFLLLFTVISAVFTVLSCYHLGK